MFVKVYCFLYSFLRKRVTAAEALIAALRFESVLPVKFLAVPVLTILTSFAVSLAISTYHIHSLTRVILSVPLDIIPNIITIMAYSLLACQVITVDFFFQNGFNICNRMVFFRWKLCSERT